MVHHFKDRAVRLWRPVGIALLVFGLACRLIGVLHVKAGLSHDESISYLCASATQGEYDRSLPALRGSLMTAARVQSFYRQPEAFDPSTVAHDLAAYDNHPPLYFWLLHGAVVLFGSSVHIGALINICLSLLMLLLLFRIAERALGSSASALAVCVIWYLSPAVVQIDLEARHYQLFGLLALLQCVLVWKILQDGSSAWSFILLTVVNTGGFLTHYYYGFILVPGAVLLLARYGLGRVPVLYGISVIASLCLFLLAFPSFFEFLRIYIDRPEAVAEEGAGVVGRAHKFLAATLEFFAHGRIAHLVLVVVAAAILVRVVWVRGAKALMHLDVTPLVRFHLWQVSWCLVFTAVLYVAGIAPLSAAGEQYSAYIWPSLALVLVAIVRSALPIVWALALGAFQLAQLAILFPSAISDSSYVSNVLPLHWYHVMDSSDLVISNEESRGMLPRIALHLDPGTRLFITQGSMGAAQLPQGNVSICVLRRKGTPAGPMSGQFKELQEAGYRGTTEASDRFELTTFIR